MSVQSVARVLLRAEEGHALLALHPYLGHSKFLEGVSQTPLALVVVTIVAVDVVDVRRADGAGLDRCLWFWWWWCVVGGGEAGRDEGGGLLLAYAMACDAGAGAKKLRQRRDSKPARRARRAAGAADTGEEEEGGGHHSDEDIVAPPNALLRGEGSAAEFGSWLAAAVRALPISRQFPDVARRGTEAIMRWRARFQRSHPAAWGRFWKRGRSSPIS